ncbi:unnamed protein product [Cylicocyclus nassatus]|uniref:Uncharacterized protein n=1 Tax=Cylicocyclus nassatus TaxID=53992 RepID=A0AA36HBA0_CYLNA|nr:unnamed protein product [Cylicocyclus nassatus]
MYDDEYVPQYLTLGASSSGDDLSLTGNEKRLGTSRIATHAKSHFTATSSQTDEDEPGPSNHLLASNSFADVVANAMQEIAISLPKLGKILRQFYLDVANKETLYAKLENTFVNMDHVKKMLDNVETIRSSSDSVVRALTVVVREQNQFIAGMATVMDYMLTKQREQVRQLQKTNYRVSKTSEKWLPEGYVFQRKNITRTWIWREEMLFKEVNLLELLESWKPPTRTNKHDQFLKIVDFYRHYLVNACFALDALGLYVDDLLLPASELMRNPTIWWTNLGKDDKERTKIFDMLSQARMY